MVGSSGRSSCSSHAKRRTTTTVALAAIPSPSDSVSTSQGTVATRCRRRRHHHETQVTVIPPYGFSAEWLGNEDDLTSWAPVTIITKNSQNPCCHTPKLINVATQQMKYVFILIRNNNIKLLEVEFTAVCIMLANAVWWLARISTDVKLTSKTNLLQPCPLMTNDGRRVIKPFFIERFSVYAPTLCCY